MRFLRHVVHKGLDELAVQAYRLRPLHPPRLSTGPLAGSPDRPAGGIPEVGTIHIPLKRRAHRLMVPSPVPGIPEPNHVLPLHVFPPRGPSKGVVVFSPFWQIPGCWALSTYINLVRGLGMHAVVYTPPDHMDRTPPSYFSGERLLGWDLPYMERMLQLTAAELVAVTRGLKARGKPVYLVGLSLGGLYAAMAALSGAPVDGLALLTPAADIQVSMGETAIGRRYRALVAQRGDALPSDDLLTQLGIPYRARSFDRPLDAKRIFLAHGEHDGVVPLGVATQLADRWGVPLRSYPAGHMSLLFLQPRVRRDLGRFLADCLRHDALPPPRPRVRLRPSRTARRLLGSLPHPTSLVRAATTLGGLRAELPPG